MSAGKVIAQGPPQDLILRYLARETVEIEATPEEEYALLRQFDEVPQLYRAGNRTMIYLDHPQRLLDRIRDLDRSDWGAVIVRPTNLEDVFLTLTGATLEDSP